MNNICFFLSDDVDNFNPYRKVYHWIAYNINSLFLIVGIKTKLVVMKNDGLHKLPIEIPVYVLKPLDNDVNSENINKQPVWQNCRPSVIKNENDFSIIEDNDD